MLKFKIVTKRKHMNLSNSRLHYRIGECAAVIGIMCDEVGAYWL